MIHWALEQRHWITQKWESFIYNYRWSDYVPMLDGKIARLAVAVPVVGYMVLFNDYVAAELTFDKITESSPSSEEVSLDRLRFIYFGLIFLGIANALYRIFRPWTLKIGSNQFDYVEKALLHFTAGEYIDLHGKIREGHYTLHGKYYDSAWNGFLKIAMGKEGQLRDVDNVPGNWSRAKQEYEHLLRSILIETFFREDTRKKCKLTMCITVSMIGYFLLFIPSFHLFIQILINCFPV